MRWGVGVGGFFKKTTKLSSSEGRVGGFRLAALWKEKGNRMSQGTLDTFARFPQVSPTAEKAICFPGASLQVASPAFRPLPLVAKGASPSLGAPVSPAAEGLCRSLYTYRLKQRQTGEWDPCTPSPQCFGERGVCPQAPTVA